MKLPNTKTFVVTVAASVLAGVIVAVVTRRLHRNAKPEGKLA